MQAIEFDTVARDGILKIPAEHQDWYDKPVRVFLLPEPQSTIKQPSDTEIQTFSATEKPDLQNDKSDREAGPDALKCMADMARPLGPADLARHFDRYTGRVLSDGFAE